MNRACLTILLIIWSLTMSPSTNAGTMPDTWSATDALGRTLPTAEQVGPPREGKFVGAFYFLWLGEHGRRGPYDITKILAQDPDAMSKPDSPLWGPLHAYHHWGEPLFGYYLSDDPWVLRKHAQMLSDAGVDVVIFDVTNQATYQKNYLALCKVWTQVRKEGGATPQIAFLTPFWDPNRVVRTLYDDFYSEGLYKDLWFHWKGKPLILADSDKAPEDTRDFFTFRKPEPSYFSGPSGPNQWSWLEVYPQHEFYNEAGKCEQMSVGVGQNGILPNRCAAFSEKNTHGRSWHSAAQDSATLPPLLRGDTGGLVSLGLNVKEQWERALKVDPEFIFITGWNEWIAMRFDEFNGVREPVMFVDQFTQEKSRDIEPMLGGHSDSYYYQMVDYIRRFKGARPAPTASAPKAITIDGKFGDWKSVTPEYTDDAFDTEHRDHPGWNPETRYSNTTGRNDFVSLKVARDDTFIYFYARTREPITPHTDRNWMLLFINTDLDASTGWNGYNFVVNRKVRDASVSLLERWNAGGAWESSGGIRYAVKSCEMELAIPRRSLGFGDAANPIKFEFKWADNIQSFDPVEFTVNGDAAPNGRFAYDYRE